MKKQIIKFNNDHDEVYKNSDAYLSTRAVFDKTWVICEACQITENENKTSVCTSCGRKVCDRCFNADNNLCEHCSTSEKDAVMTWAVGSDWSNIKPIDSIQIINERTGMDIDITMDKSASSIYRKIRAGYYRMKLKK
jgi:hypothetical protein